MPARPRIISAVSIALLAALSIASPAASQSRGSAEIQGGGAGFVTGPVRLEGSMAMLIDSAIVSIMSAHFPLCVSSREPRTTFFSSTSLMFALKPAPSPETSAITTASASGMNGS